MVVLFSNCRYHKAQESQKEILRQQIHAKAQELFEEKFIPTLQCQGNWLPPCSSPSIQQLIRDAKPLGFHLLSFYHCVLEYIRTQQRVAALGRALFQEDVVNPSLSVTCVSLTPQDSQIGSRDLVIVGYIAENIAPKDLGLFLAKVACPRSTDGSDLWVADSHALDVHLERFSQWKQDATPSIFSQYYRILEWHKGIVEMTQLYEEMNRICGALSQDPLFTRSIAFSLFVYYGYWDHALRDFLSAHDFCPLVLRVYFEQLETYWEKVNAHAICHGVFAKICRQVQHGLDSLMQIQDPLFASTFPSYLQTRVLAKKQHEMKTYLEQMTPERIDTLFPSSRRIKKSRIQRTCKAKICARPQELGSETVELQKQKILPPHPLSLKKKIGKIVSGLKICHQTILPWKKVHTRVSRFFHLLKISPEHWCDVMSSFTDQGAVRYSTTDPEAILRDAWHHLLPIHMGLLSEKMFFYRQGDSFTALGRLKYPDGQHSNYGIVELAMGRHKVLVHLYFRPFAYQVNLQDFFQTDLQTPHISPLEQDQESFEDSWFQARPCTLQAHESYVSITDVHLGLSLDLIPRVSIQNETSLPSKHVLKEVY